jgi:hypothetical protein
MSSRKTLLLPALALAALSTAVAAQSVLGVGDVGVVTSTGFWRLRGSPSQAMPVNHILPSSFDPSLTTLTDPRLEWEEGTDRFIVCAGSKLYRVTITSLTTATVGNLTPSVGGPAAFTSIDIHPGTGELYLYDSTSMQVFGFAPPFAAGMTPDVVLSPPDGYRGMCTVSRQYPPSIALSDSTSIERLPLDGAAAIGVSQAGASAIEDNPQLAQIYLVRKGANVVGVATKSTLTMDLNITALCAPVALGPVAVAPDPHTERVYVLAADGVGCLGASAGGNHVVSLPPALGPAPQILTNPLGSGITGDAGDLALVVAPYAFPAPYGFACAAPGTGKPTVLDCDKAPFIGHPSFQLRVTGAPANAPLFLIFGFAPLAQLLPSGCTLLVAAAVAPFPLGTSGGDGKLFVTTSLPATLPPGLETYQQVAFVDGGKVRLSNGLMLHFE